MTETQCSTAFQVVVRSPAGDEMQLEAPFDATAEDLKREVDRHMGVPPMCQALIVGTETLDDLRLLDGTGRLLAHCARDGAGVLQVSLVVSLEKAYSALDLPYPDCLEAVKAIADVVEPGDDHALTTLTARLSACTGGGAAAEALSRVAVKGDERVIDSLINAIDIVDPLKTAYIVRAIARVAEPGHQQAIAAICAVREHPLAVQHRHLGGDLGIEHQHLRVAISESLQTLLPHEMPPDALIPCVQAVRIFPYSGA